MPRISFALVPLVAVLAVRSDAAADESSPVVVEALGPKAVRIELSEGHTKPCDSNETKRLFVGWIQPGTRWTTTVGSHCVCMRHTFDNFPNTNWSGSHLFCSTRSKYRPGPDPTIRIAFSSTQGSTEQPQ